MSENSEIFDPSDLIKIKKELNKEVPKPPCNVWSIIKDNMKKIEGLEERIKKLEEAKP